MSGTGCDGGRLGAQQGGAAEYKELGKLPVCTPERSSARAVLACWNWAALPLGT